jgi:hypothetical protein
MIKIHVHSRNNTLALTLRVTQKHIIHPPNKIFHPSVMTLSLKFTFGKRKYGLWEKIHAKKHERKSMLKSMREKKTREIAHIFKTEAMGESHVKRNSN